MTGSAVKVLSMELVPHNKVHREEAKSGDSISILKKSKLMEAWHPSKLFSAELVPKINRMAPIQTWHQKLIKWNQI